MPVRTTQEQIRLKPCPLQPMHVYTDCVQLLESGGQVKGYRRVVSFDKPQEHDREVADYRGCSDRAVTSGCGSRKGLPAWIFLALIPWVLALVFPLPEGRAATRTLMGDHLLTRWSIDDGLPHNLPLAITQDKQGHIWIATAEGVSRFNGHHFVNYNRRNAEGADLSGSSSLLAEADGSLLVGTETGIYRFSGDAWSFLHPGLAGIPVVAMARTVDGDLWVASGNTLLRLDRRGSLETLSSSMQPLQMLAVSEGPEGTLLLGTDQGLFDIHDGQLRPFSGAEVLAGKKVLHIIQDGDGWLISSSAGLWRLEANGHLVAQPFDKQVNLALRGRDKALWINPAKGDLLERLPWGVTNYFPMGGLRSRALFVDRDQAVWGGSTEGLFRIDLGAARLLPHGEGYIHVILEDTDDVLWIGHQAGLRRITEGKEREVLDTSVLSLAMALDGNGVWVGTDEHGVMRIDREGRRIKRLSLDDGQITGPVLALLQTDDGAVWIGSATQGLLRWQAGKLHAVGGNEDFPIREIMMLRTSSAGGVWVGTKRGLAHVDADDHVRYWKPDSDIPARRIYDLLEDADGTVWLASDRGLLRWRDGRFTVFDSSKGLPRERLLRVIECGNHLWLSSSRGVFRVLRHDLDLVATGQRSQLHLEIADHHDGLLGAQVNGGSWPAGWLTRDGRLLYPMADGVSMLVPRELVTQSVAVPVDLERVLVDGVVYYPKGSLDVLPSAQRLTFSFTGLEFHAPERVRYRYRLLGFDADWSSTGSLGQAAYTNLPPGNYQLQIEAMSTPVDWSDRARIGSYQLDVDVAAPWWRHPLSVGAGAGLMLFGMYGLMWVRVMHYRRRQQRLNSIIAQRTDELMEKNTALELADRERDALVQRLAHQATHDALTELPNRRAADTHLKDALEQALAADGELAVVLIDIDYFKQVNDTYGHDAGDLVLAAIGELLRSLSASQVFAARQGGEEFLVVLEGKPEASVRQWLESLRHRLETQPIVLADGQSVRCTVSGGVAFLGEQTRDVRSLLATADANLYQAKRSGRNRMVG